MCEMTTGLKATDVDALQREYLLAASEWQDAHRAMVTIAEDLKAVEREHLACGACCPDEEIRMREDIACALLRAAEARDRIARILGRASGLDRGAADAIVHAR
jgi:hypothetical protein